MATVNQVIGAYVKLRNELGDERKKFEAYETETKLKMAKLERWLFAQTQEQGVNSFNTTAGTAFKTTSDRITIEGDEGWQKLTDYVRQTGDFSVFQRRCGKNHIKELFANGFTPSELGVSHETHQIIQVRAPSK